MKTYGELLGRMTGAPPSLATEIHCAKTVPESNVFMSFGLAFERKQIPRFVGNVSS